MTPVFMLKSDMQNLLTAHPEFKRFYACGKDTSKVNIILRALKHFILSLLTEKQNRHFLCESQIETV